MTRAPLDLADHAMIVDGTDQVGPEAPREALALRVLTAHAALKAEATAPEWKKLRKLEMEMITSAATRSLGQAAPSGKEG